MKNQQFPSIAKMSRFLLPAAKKRETQGAIKIGKNDWEEN